MIEPLNAILAQSEGVNLVLLIGLAILAGTVGAKIITTLHIPQIIGYIVLCDYRQQTKRQHDRPDLADGRDYPGRHQEYLHDTGIE